MDKRGLIGLIVVTGVLLIVGFVWFISQMGGDVVVCVRASCCHASECVLESEAPNCSGTLCSMSCEPGTLDCGQARCEYVDGDCEVVLNE